MIQVFKILKGFDDVATSPFFSPTPISVTRGHELKVAKEFCRTSKKQSSFKHRVISAWNDLPPSVVISDTVNCFKNNLNKCWLDKPNKFYLN